ncbi:hypothetical protein PLESTB_001578400 [Pleodorina starrii]|uniref:MYND-type domain-containing protein n=1 Tax=Pleodorina starrii TaxID=330485 RepID=A0A9W6BXP8_9CHLO|nr:hypothetical protein PLESTM_000726700 [Pleodorina starrii]GLC60143.1 hypothetical protein PLESTB_001578400 [Pleodorina starrii]GLC70045.1 hypothetical protein PLESTF_000916900 [Pleodorina starrii]
MTRRRSRAQRRNANNDLDTGCGLSALDGFARRAALGDTSVTAMKLVSLAKAFTYPLPAIIVDMSASMAADLFAMLAVALRRSSPAAQDVDEAARGLYRTLRRGLSHFISDAMNVQAREVQMLLASLLLRTDVLRCYAMLLRDAGRQLQQHSTSSSSNVATTEALLSEVSGLLRTLDSAASKVAWVKGDGPSADPRIHGPGAMTAEQFLRTLSAELRASSLLDAWVTFFLQLRGCASSDMEQAAPLLCAFTDAVRRYSTWFGDRGLAFCAGATTDTGLHYLLAAHVVGLVDAIDGGMQYGVHDDAPLLPLAQAPGEDDKAQSRASASSASSGAIFLDTSLLKVALQWWSYFRDGAATAAAAAFPPWNNAATFDICIRLVHAAVAAAARPRDRVRDVGRSREPGAVRLAPSACGQVTMLALQCAESALRGIISRRSLRPRGGGGGGVPGRRPEDVERLRALWAAYMAAVDASVEWVLAGGGDSDDSDGDYWGDFNVFIINDLMPNTGHSTAGPPLPSALGVEAEVVLSAGVVARMERLIRVAVFYAPPLCGVESWNQILMFGPVSELAAMIATAAKYAGGSLPETAGWEGRLEPETEDDPARCRATELARGFTAAARFLGVTTSPGGGLRDQLAAVLLAGSGGASGGEAGGGGRRPDQGDGAGDACSQGSAAGESSRGGGSAAGSSKTGGAGGGSAADGSRSSRSSQAEAAGVQQLLDLTSFAFVRLLPVISRAMQHFHLPALDHLPGLEKLTSGVAAPLQVVLRTCLLVLHAAAAAAQPPPPPPCREDVVAPGSGVGGGGGAANSPSHPHPGAGAQSAAAEVAAAAAQWRRLLLVEVGAVELLGAAARALSFRRRRLQETTERASWAQACGDTFGAVLCWMCAVFPDEMRAALGGGSGHNGGRIDPAASIKGATEPSSAAAQLRACLALPVIARLLGPNGDFPNPTALAVVRALMKGGAAPKAPGLGAAAHAVAAALPPPVEVRRRMAPYCCANATCVNRDGPSELALPRRRCGGGCGGAVWWYCSRKCQVAHWRAGHKAECEAAGARAGACGGQGHSSTVGTRG